MRGLIVVPIALLLSIVVAFMALTALGITAGAWTEEDCRKVNWDHPDCKTPTPSPTQTVAPTPTPTVKPTITPAPPTTLPTCPPNLVGVATGCTRTPTPAPTLIPPVTTTPAPTPQPTIRVLPNTSTD